MSHLTESYAVLDKLRLKNGMYLASTSTDYHYTWLRDTFYEVLPYLDKDTDKYEVTYHRILDLFKEYEWKLDIHGTQKPVHMHEYIHARYDADTVTELPMEWGHAQHDAVGAILFGIAIGLMSGHAILRDAHDERLVQKLVDYLITCEYWADPDNGMWEEWREVHSSSVGAVVAALTLIKQLNIAIVPEWAIQKGERTLYEMFPHESTSRPTDLAQLSLIYPYRVHEGFKAEEIIKRVERDLLRNRGVLRYKGDSYYSTIEHVGRGKELSHYYGTEAEWTFGLPWLALCHMELGNYQKAQEYIQWTESVMLEESVLPELYYAGTYDPNPNTPLGWANSMYIQAKERFALLTGEPLDEDEPTEQQLTLF